MALISMTSLRDKICLTIPKSTPYEASRNIKIENINNFNSMDRSTLIHSHTEKRIKLYETRSHESIYIQFPGVESTRSGGKTYINDFRPILQRADGSYLEDMDFKKIWDIIDSIGQSHKADIDILATLFLRIAYMIDYKHNDSTYISEQVNYDATGQLTFFPLPQTHLIWNSLDLDPDVIDTINDRFGQYNGISIEAFLYYNDLLAQNEDCKYHYIQTLSKKKWDISIGRINNCLSHLTVISHIRGYIGISKLIDSFQRTGVAPLPQKRFSEACGSLVTRM